MSWEKDLEWGIRKQGCPPPSSALPPSYVKETGTGHGRKAKEGRGLQPGRGIKLFLPFLNHRYHLVLETW